MSAQVVFVDKDGKELANGATITMDKVEKDIFDEILVALEGVKIKNTTSNKQTFSLEVEVISLPHGSFVCSYGTSCRSFFKAGSFTLKDLTINGSATSAITNTEWLIEEEGKSGTCNVNFKLSTGNTLNVSFVYGSNEQTSQEQCQQPTIIYENGMLSFVCDTKGAEFHYTITSSDATNTYKNSTGKVNLVGNYIISCYATANGYTQSNVSTRTLDLLSGIGNDIIIYKDREEKELEDDTNLDGVPNVSYVPNASFMRGENAQISIHMKNAAQISSFEFDVLLPGGLELTLDADDYPMTELSTYRTNSRKTDTFITSKNCDGSLHIKASSSSNAPLIGNDGEIVKINIFVQDNIAIGEHPIYLNNVVLKDINGTYYNTETVKSTITVVKRDRYDINADGRVTIEDITNLVNSILNK